MYSFLGAFGLALIFLNGYAIYKNYSQRQASHIERDPSSIVPIQPLESDIYLNPFRPDVAI